MKENEKGQQNNYDILYAEKTDINILAACEQDSI